MDLTFTEILWLIITIFVGVIAIKITFTFDINKYLESRKEDIDKKLRIIALTCMPKTPLTVFR